METFVDYETYSDEDITGGAHRYASHPSTQILLCAVRQGKETRVWQSPGHVLSNTSENEQAISMLKNATSFWAHNAPFEYAVSLYRMKADMGLEPPAADQWNCTAAMCRRAAIPWSLEKAGEFLKLPMTKQKVGKRLIQLFCVRSGWNGADTVTVEGSKITPEAAWNMFVDYCRTDVVVENQIRDVLHTVTPKGWTKEHFVNDLILNARGIPVDVEALDKAQDLLDTMNGRLEESFHAVTGLTTSQTKAFTVWAKEHGYPFDNLQAATTEQFLADPGDAPKEVVDAVSIRAKASFAATKKITSMRELVMPDGRVRDCFMWSGAVRTHRHAGRNIQPQNYKRSTKRSPSVMVALQNGATVDDMLFLYDGVHEPLAEAVRHFIRHPEYPLFDADFSQIEARTLLYLAGQTDVLDEYRRGEDPYKNMASVIYRKLVKDITKDERFIGKTAVLGCGYATGAEKFKMMCEQYGTSMSLEEAKRIVTVYREKHYKVKSLWKEMGSAAAEAINYPGVKVECRKVSFVRNNSLGFDSLLMRLPSGHVLSYPFPQIKKVMKTFKRDDGGENEWEVDEITYFGQITGQANWGRVRTHGGVLTENATQAVAGDFMALGTNRAMKAGYDIFLIVHDQVVATAYPHQTKEGLKAALCELPSWAEDFPLDATCDITPFYTKD